MSARNASIGPFDGQPPGTGGVAAEIVDRAASVGGLCGLVKGR